MKIDFRIKRAQIIASSEFGYDFCKNEFDLAHIPPMERRRLNLASKCAFSLIKELDSSTPLVFSSFCGEINNCYTLLKSLISDNFLISPTLFSHSVLNASPALLAIYFKNHSEISAISCKPSLEYGILNAYLRLIDGAQNALVMSYFEELGGNKFYMCACEISKDIGRKASLECRANLQAEIKTNISDFIFMQHFLDEKSSSWAIESDLIWEWKL